MTSIATYTGVVRNGKVELGDKVTLPDGVDVFIVVPAVIDEQNARRQANVWLLEHVGNLTSAEHPRLVNLQGDLVWHFKAFLTNSMSELLGPIGNVLINATTGQILSNARSAEQMLENVQNFKHPVLSSAG